MVYLGVDGGGTHTVFCLCDAHGHVLGELSTGPLDYHEAGFKGYADHLKEGALAILAQTGTISTMVRAVTVGTPCFGESAGDSRKLERLAKEALPKSAGVFVVNDVLCAMYGALAVKPGICILSGTGSMAMGMDAQGAIVRAGGWSHVFSDTGSCYWLGQQAMVLFAKEAEEIMPKGELFRIIMKEYGLTEPMDIIPQAENAILHRDQTAAFQALLFEAARAGDKNALSLYSQAAKELAMLADSVRRRLSFDFEGEVTVSYAGGLFETGVMILEPLKQALAEKNMKLVRPLLKPPQGAALYALIRSGAATDEATVLALAGE